MRRRVYREVPAGSVSVELVRVDHVANGLETTARVLERQVQNIAWIDLDTTEGSASPCDGHRQIEREPGLPELRRPTEEVQALGQQAGHRELDVGNSTV